MTSSLIRKFLKNKQCYKGCYGENVERYDIECDRCLWQILIETFGNDLTVIKSDDEKVLVILIAIIGFIFIVKH